ncbi:MAG: hypothetical protein ACMUEL_07700 [Flavobacteriales bacterium Tduv]
MSPFASKGTSTYVMEDQKEEGKKKISQRKARVKKRDSNRNRYSKKMAQEIR